MRTSVCALLILQVSALCAFVIATNVAVAPSSKWARKPTSHYRPVPTVVHRFFDGYFGALSRCEVPLALQFWTADARIYLPNGVVVGKSALENNLHSFCRTFSGMRFATVGVERVDARSYLATVRISAPGRLAKPVEFSDAFVFRFVRCRRRRLCARASRLVTTLDTSVVQSTLL